jgi:hypothetical protein
MSRDGGKVITFNRAHVYKSSGPRDDSARHFATYLRTGFGYNWRRDAEGSKHRALLRYEVA